MAEPRASSPGPAPGHIASLLQPFLLKRRAAIRGEPVEGAVLPPDLPVCPGGHPFPGRSACIYRSGLVPPRKINLPAYALTGMVTVIDHGHGCTHVSILPSLSAVVVGTS